MQMHKRYDLFLMHLAKFHASSLQLPDASLHTFCWRVSKVKCYLQVKSQVGYLPQGSQHMLERCRIPSLLSALLVLTWIAFTVLAGALSGFSSIAHQR